MLKRGFFRLGLFRHFLDIVRVAIFSVVYLIGLAWPLTGNLQGVRRFKGRTDERWGATVFSASRLAACSLVLSTVLVVPASAQKDGSGDAVDAQGVLVRAAQDIQQRRVNAQFINLLRKANGVFIVPELGKVSPLLNELPG